MISMWVSREGRFDGMGGACILSRKLHEAKISHIIDFNKLAAHFKNTCGLDLTYISIDPQESVFVTFVDAAGTDKGEAHSQAGNLVGVTKASFARGRETAVNLIAGRSGKIERMCNSSLAAEAYSLVSGCACAEWVQACYSEASNSCFDLQWARVRLGEWCNSDITRRAKLRMDGACVLKDSSSAELRENLQVTDAKSLYDACRKAARGKEPRIGIAVGEAKESMAVTGTVARWCPHNFMLADPLTKSLHKSNVAPLMKAMQSGLFTLKCEQDEEQYRKELKESGQTLSRLKGMTLRKGYKLGADGTEVPRTAVTKSRAGKRSSRVASKARGSGKTRQHRKNREVRGDCRPASNRPTA